MTIILHITYHKSLVNSNNFTYHKLLVSDNNFTHPKKLLVNDNNFTYHNSTKIKGFMLNQKISD